MPYVKKKFELTALVHVDDNAINEPATDGRIAEVLAICIEQEAPGIADVQVRFLENLPLCPEDLRDLT